MEGVICFFRHETYLSDAVLKYPGRYIRVPHIKLDCPISIGETPGGGTLLVCEVSLLPFWAIPLSPIQAVGKPGRQSARLKPNKGKALCNKVIRIRDAQRLPVINPLDEMYPDMLTFSRYVFTPRL